MDSAQGKIIIEYDDGHEQIIQKFIKCLLSLGISAVELKNDSSGYVREFLIKK